MIKTNEKKGITLIALVITIIILLILAGVAISSLMGSGLFNKAIESKDKAEIAQEVEQLKLAIYAVKADYLNNNGNIYYSEIEKEIKNSYGESIKATNGIKPVYVDDNKEIEIIKSKKNNIVSKLNNEFKLSNLFMSTVFADDTNNAVYAKVTYKSNRVYYIRVDSKNESLDPDLPGKTGDIIPTEKILDDKSGEDDVGGNKTEENKTDGNNTSVDDTVGEDALAKKVRPGEYVEYIPDLADTTEILDELTDNSGSKQNTEEALVQEKDFKWIVLDVVDDQVRLISEIPTTTKVGLEGYNGYNNAVYLLDKTCKTLYNKAKYTNNVQNLKIEDIVKYMKTKPTKNTGVYSPKYSNYPSILIQEKDQTIDGVEQPDVRLDVSEQNFPIKQTKENEATSWNLNKTYWFQSMLSTGLNEGYFNIFVSNYQTYWISSRAVDANDNLAEFYVYQNTGSTLSGINLYQSSGWNNNSSVNSLRPVITLKSNVKVISGDGKLETPYKIDI